MVISPAGLRSVFPQQPGLEVAISQQRCLLVVVSPSMAELVKFPSKSKTVVSPQSALVVSSLAKSPNGSGSEEVIPGDGCLFPSSSAIPQQGGYWSVVEFLSRVPRAPQKSPLRGILFMHSSFR